MNSRPQDGPPVSAAHAASAADTACFHCGLPCGRAAVESDGKAFCCPGCLAVYDVLQAGGLGRFYELQPHGGVRMTAGGGAERWAFLDEPAVTARLLDFTDGRLSRVTFQVPSIHCVACVWLLENLFQLHPGVGRSRVNFARRELTVDFRPREMSLSEVAALLASLGYEPSLTLSALEQPVPDRTRRRQMLQTGVAGFAFGNIMLFSLPVYLGLDSLSGPGLERVFGFLSLVLALPVLVFSASDYWRSALLSLQQRILTLDVPIALGLTALYGQSAWEILSGSGSGYLDSLSGLVFFLLCGRWFQEKTHARLTFDRDYRSFFPLAATRKSGSGPEETVALSSLRVGDRLLLRHGELVPADARLVEGAALIDYSFVTGESEPVERQPGEVLYAGGRQAGGLIEVEIVKPVSQSYLASLWGHEAFRKAGQDKLRTLHNLTNRFSRWFTAVVVGVAIAAGLSWWIAGDPSRGLRAFVAVLIVACPCALALASPFALGTARRWLARADIFLRTADVLERMAAVGEVVFDKTGTLTVVEPGRPRYQGADLTSAQRRQLASLARQSSHPLAQRLSRALREVRSEEPVSDFREETGLGISGSVNGVRWLAGSRAWLEAAGVEVSGERAAEGSTVHVASDGVYRGLYSLATRLRPGLEGMVRGLSEHYGVALLSGDHEGERAAFRALLGPEARLQFNQSPMEKLESIRMMQDKGVRVAMVGDGLNDAGALSQSDVGVAVVEQVGSFSPASDVILAGRRVAELSRVFELARATVRVVIFCFALSALYNALGVSIAAAGWLSPVVCAVLMPISSVTVVSVACLATTRVARRLGLGFDLGQGPLPDTERQFSEERV